MVFIIANIFITFTKQNSFPIVNWGVFSTPYPKLTVIVFLLLKKTENPWNTNYLGFITDNWPTSFLLDFI